jgi:DNA-directed RNA polymerase subunit RPC12/RpoP
MVNQLNDQRESDGWEHAVRCPACGVDELDSLYDDLSGDTAYLCAHCGYHAVTAWEVRP